MPLICLALLHLLGRHWAVLQAIAWAQIHSRRFSTASISNYQELVSEFFTKSPAIARSLLREREGQDCSMLVIRSLIAAKSVLPSNTLGMLAPDVLLLTFLA
jgi:hypothetical protein